MKAEPLNVVRLVHDAEPRDKVPVSGLDSWWHVTWAIRHLLGRESVGPFTIRIRRWCDLDVWVTCPETAVGYWLTPARRGYRDDQFYLLKPVGGEGRVMGEDDKLTPTTPVGGITRHQWEGSAWA